PTGLNRLVCASDAAFLDECSERIFLTTIFPGSRRDTGWRIKPFALPLQATTYQPGQNARRFLFQTVFQAFIGLALVFGSWVVNETQFKWDQQDAAPQRVIIRWRVWLVICQHKQLVCGFKCVRLAVQGARIDGPAASDQLDLCCIQPVPLPGFACPY